MFQNQGPNNTQRTIRTIRVPKVFQLPRDEEKLILPKIVKVLILIILVILGLAYLFFFSSVFKIKNIEIVGSPSEAVKQKLEDLKGKNIFSFSAAHLEGDIIVHNQNYLSVQVFRGLPDTVKVKFQDREPKIIWASGNHRYLVDKDAILFQEFEGSSDLPIVVDANNLAVEIPIQIATPNFVEFVKSARVQIQELDIEVLEFQVNETTFQIDAVTNKGFRMIFDTTRPLSEQIEAFKTVYEKRRDQIKEYIDLRVEGWVYFK